MGLGETGATLGSGAMAGLLGMPYGVYKGVTSGKLGTREANRIAEEEARKFMEQYTYQPRGKVAPEMMQTIGGLLESSKLPPILPEAAMLASIPRQAVAAQAERAGMAAERAVAPVVERTMQKGGLGAGLLSDMSRGSVSPLDVYHGSPYKLSPTETNLLGEFDASKIGSGAGAQAYGYGIYTSESPQFADYYAVRKGLPDLEGIASQNGIELSKDARIELMRQATRDSKGRPTKADNYVDPTLAVKKLQNANIETRQLSADKLQNTIREFQEQNKAFLYKADLPDEKIAKMLDWENPVPEDLRKRVSEVMMKEFGSGATGTSGEKLYKEIQAEYRRAGSENPAKDASMFLQKQGIPGITYKEIDTRNFVTFPNEEKNIKILERQNR
jgi:hypothetical protein